ncbi:MAG: hypothetical protein K2Q12_06590 [Rickettsiales bacterium]|nr:hypothetical protein [Rickettsiales bacterium]
MVKLSRSEQIIAEKTVCVLLVRGENPDGTPIFAYVAVRADKLEEFMTAQKTGLFYPEDYGIIIESGEGLPSDEVRERMEREYGFNHAQMLDIPDESQAGQLTQSIVSSKSDT